MVWVRPSPRPEIGIEHIEIVLAVGVAFGHRRQGDLLRPVENQVVDRVNRERYRLVAGRDFHNRRRHDLGRV